MSDHIGRRRRRSKVPIGRIALLVAFLGAMGYLLALPEPVRSNAPTTPLRVVPMWSAPPSVALPGQLADGTRYTPRVYLNPTTSVGVALTSGGRSVRLILRADGGRTIELRRVSADDHPQFDGFTASGTTLVWAETVTPEGANARTSLWRTNWRNGSRPTQILYDAGDANFYGGQYDLLLHGNRVYWTVIGSETTTVLRSVALSGGNQTSKNLNGRLALSVWPWAASVDGGRGKPVVLVNYDTNQKIAVTTTAGETAVCSPQWCRIGVLGENALERIDLQHPDGSDRRRVAGTEATPTIADVALLDRFVPLTTDRGDDAASVGVGLSLYDISTGQTILVAVDVANVQAHDTLLWWSTSSGDDLTWHVLDLRTLS